MTLASAHDFMLTDGHDVEGLFATFDPTDGKRGLLIGNADGTFDLDPADWSCWRIDRASHPLILVEPLQVEVDLASAFDSETNHVAYGTIVRRAERFTLHTKSFDQHNMAKTLRIDLLTNLPKAPIHASVGFAKWELIRGAGSERQVFQEFDVGRATDFVR